jgi:aminomethyltransferase
VKRTPLYTTHRALGARFVEFGGWEMPVQYTSIVDEHVAVRERVGLFDVSHMGEIELRGARALAACQELTVNDVTRLHDGQAQYSLLCRPNGGVVDDVIVHRLSGDRLLICVNAGNIAKDLAWIREHCAGADVLDRSDDFAQLALQGPRATATLAALTQLPLDDIRRFEFREGMVAGQPALVAHTGYTGEDGWELYCAPDKAVALWQALVDAGQPHGLAPAGLGARDTLRLESALPLYGHELTDDTTPLEAGLRWVVHFEKPRFVGREALARQHATGTERRLVGVVLTDPGIPRQGYRVLSDEQPVGTISSGTKSPTLGRAIGMAYVNRPWQAVGTRLAVEIRGRAARAEVVPLPFYRR